MNIFFLSANPKKNAKYTCDVHLWRMLDNCIQILSANYRVIMGEVHANYADEFHMPTTAPAYDPIVVWTRDSYSNFYWMCMYCKALIREITYRFGYSVVNEEKILSSILDHINWIKMKLPDTTRIHFPFENVPIEYSIPSDVFANHQYWYLRGFGLFTKSWSKRPIPDWFEIIEKIHDRKIPRSDLKRSPNFILQSDDHKRQRTLGLYDVLSSVRLLESAGGPPTHPMQPQ